MPADAKTNSFYKNQQTFRCAILLRVALIVENTNGVYDAKQSSQLFTETPTSKKKEVDKNRKPKRRTKP